MIEWKRLRFGPLAVAVMIAVGWCNISSAQWREVYAEDFDDLETGHPTATEPLDQWERELAAGRVKDGGTRSSSGKYLAALRDWQTLSHGPILYLDLSEYPHDRVRVNFDIYTFGDWRGLQSPTGGPQHRLIFADHQANPEFTFDTNFSTNLYFSQSWPYEFPMRRRARTGSRHDATIDTGRPFSNAHRWRLEFEYESDSNDFRFSILSGSSAGNGRPIPDFGIDNVVVEVHVVGELPIPTSETLRPPRDQPQE